MRYFCKVDNPIRRLNDQEYGLYDYLLCLDRQLFDEEILPDVLQNIRDKVKQLEERYKPVKPLNLKIQNPLLVMKDVIVSADGVTATFYEEKS